ncbi:MAG TPA: hypothetical protein VF143_01425, partial [Candidatus Nanopelagicales bacterium]
MEQHPGHPGTLAGSREEVARHVPLPAEVPVDLRTAQAAGATIEAEVTPHPLGPVTQAVGSEAAAPTAPATPTGPSAPRPPEPSAAVIPAASPADVEPPPVTAPAPEVLVAAADRAVAADTAVGVQFTLGGRHRREPVLIAFDNARLYRTVLMLAAVFVVVRLAMWAFGRIDT